MDLLGVATDEERGELEAWLDERPENRELYERIRRELRSAEELPVFCRLDEAKAWEDFKRNREGKRRRRLTVRMTRYAAAVVVVVGAALAVWMFRGERPAGKEEAIVPGSSRATLVVASGETVVLGADGGEGVVDVTAGRQAKRLEDALVYDTTRTAVAAEEYNTLSIPRGGEFKLMLADGTLVHLNAATRLKYPVAFGGKERRVWLEGEAYFEVATDSARPFYVETADMRVRVYGTAFNVNTHKDGKTQTALVEGRVGVTVAGTEEMMMEPGELLSYYRREKTVTLEHVDTRPYVAWKEGYFAFENETLEEMMRTLALWYNVEVFFQSEEVKHFVFTGFMRKYEQIETILAAVCDVTGAHYSINGRTVVIGM